VSTRSGREPDREEAKEAADYFDGIDDEVEVVPEKGSKGNGKAPPKQGETSTG